MSGKRAQKGQARQHQHSTNVGVTRDCPCDPCLHSQGCVVECSKYKDWMSGYDWRSPNPRKGSRNV